MPIANLTTHAVAYVSVTELATYLAVSEDQVRKWIVAGQLEVHRFGPRLTRITTTSARQLERSLTRFPPQPLQ